MSVQGHDAGCIINYFIINLIGAIHANQIYQMKENTTRSVRRVPSQG